MSILARQRCFNHGEREAAVCCPECGRFFCRECATEHSGKMLCAPCIRRRAVRKEQRGSRWAGGAARMLLSAAALCLAWLCFYLVGHGLLLIPSEFHKGEFWSTGWEEEYHPSDSDHTEEDRSPPEASDAPKPEAES